MKDLFISRNGDKAKNSPRKTKHPAMRRGVLFWSLSSLHVDGIHSLRRLFSLERNFISFLEIAELHTYERLAVKEQVFRKALACDESKTLVSELLDCSCHLWFLLINTKTYVMNRLFLHATLLCMMLAYYSFCVNVFTTQGKRSKKQIEITFTETIYCRHV